MFSAESSVSADMLADHSAGHGKLLESAELPSSIASDQDSLATAVDPELLLQMFSNSLCASACRFTRAGAAAR